MTDKVSLTASMVMLVVFAFGTFNGALAHGDDHEYRDPGYGMDYPMESEGMDEYCPGCGTTGNHGMMGGYGMGPGMMGGYGMGPGMMGGHGMGPGMMGGHGMMGGGLMYGLELDSGQRKEILRIRSELRKQNWALQGEILDEQEKLFELYADETPDAKKIGSVYGKIFDLRRQMIEAVIEARNRQRAILTDEQRQQLRNDGFQNSDEHHRRPRSGGMGTGYGRQMMGG